MAGTAPARSSGRYVAPPRASSRNPPQALPRTTCVRLPDMKGTPLMDRLEAVPRDQVGRAVGIVCLVGIALIHFLDAFSVIHESAFVFVLYILLMTVTLVASAILLRTDSRRTWMLAGGTAGLTLLGFVLTRTTGLPGFPDNVGNWTEPLGLASLWVEGGVIVLSAYKVITIPPIEEG
jgi:hypothetical protein